MATHASSDQAEPDEAPVVLTIDELAAAASVPVRTIREYQRLELLPAPQRQGRVGVYGQEHQARLSIIARLQKRGYSLAAIGDLMGSWEQGRGLGSILGIGAEPAVLDETPAALTAAQLADITPAFSDPDVAANAARAQLLHQHEDVFVARSLAALELVALAIDAGMEPADAVAIMADFRAGIEALAVAVVEPFVGVVAATNSNNPSAANEGTADERTVTELTAILTRARLLMAQAAASLVVHGVGSALSDHAIEAPEGTLARAVAATSVGRIQHITVS